jgi:DNA-binding CsgD family transcriptional regulator
MDLHTFSNTRLRLSESVSEIARLDTQFDIFRFMRRLSDAYGFRAFMVWPVPPRTVQVLSGNTIITNWPSELLALFDERQLLQNSPVAQRLRQSTLPCAFSSAELAKERGNTSAQEIFNRFGMQNCIYFPVHDPSGNRCAVGYSGNDVSLTSQQTMELMYISMHVFERLTLIGSIDSKPVETLSQRESDCLNWTAAGKTSVEIASILDLSEHTVNHYLNRATKKLDAVNRTQAVANALRRGLIK